MNWFKLIIGFGAVAAVIAAIFVCQIIDYHFAQQRCDAEGDVCYGIQIQMVADLFKEKFGRYPAFGEFTNLLDATVELVPIARSPNGPDRWYYDERSGEIGLNTSGKYHVGWETVMDLSETKFRRPTKIQEAHFGRVETLDYTWANDRFDKERPEIIEVMTNLYMTNMLQLNGGRAAR